MLANVASVDALRHTKKQNGNCYSILGFYWENGKEHGNYYAISGFCWDKVCLEASMFPALNLETAKRLWLQANRLFDNSLYGELSNYGPFLGTLN